MASKIGYYRLRNTVQKMWVSCQILYVPLNKHYSRYVIENDNIYVIQLNTLSAVFEDILIMMYEFGTLRPTVERKIFMARNDPDNAFYMVMDDTSYCRCNVCGIRVPVVRSFCPLTVVILPWLMHKLTCPQLQ